MPQLFARRFQVLHAALLSLLIANGGVCLAQPGEGSNPTYQRSRSYWNGGLGAHTPTRSSSREYYQKQPPRQHSDQHYQHRRYGNPGPQVSGGSFQRPYPYHLDYYKMRWGGSYAPYFGNLYGPPDVLLGVPYGSLPYGAGPYDYGSGLYNGNALVPDAGVPYAAPPVVVP